MCLDSYYIVFTEPKSSAWYLKLLKKGFGHCYAVRAEGDKLLKFESGHRVVRVDLVELDYISKESTIVKCQAKARTSRFMINTCVGFVKFILGVDGCSLTPYQLYKRLKNELI